MTEIEFVRSFPLEITHQDRWVEISACDEHQAHPMFGAGIGEDGQWVNAASVETAMIAVLVFVVELTDEAARWHFVRKILEWRDALRAAVPVPVATSRRLH